MFGAISGCHRWRGQGATAAWRKALKLNKQGIREESLLLEWGGLRQKSHTSFLGVGKVASGEDWFLWVLSPATPPAMRDQGKALLGPCAACSSGSGSHGIWF